MRRKDDVAVRTFEVPVVERKSDAVQPQTLEKRSVFVLEEVFKELANGVISHWRFNASENKTNLIEEEFTLLLADYVRKRGTNLEFAAGVACKYVSNCPRMK